MALTWSISHAEKLVAVRVESLLRPDEVQACFAAIIAQGAVPYRKLVDLTHAPLTLGAAGIRAIAQRMAQVPDGVRRGPLAFVVNNELAKEMVVTFDHQMGVERPLAMFPTVEEARGWLDSLATGAAAVSGGSGASR